MASCLPDSPSLDRLRRQARRLQRGARAQQPEALEPADAFCSLGCLRYDERDEPPRRETAAALLADDPTLVDRSIWAAATAADADAVRRHLDRDPSLARRAGGPHRWEPLLYLCYSRVGMHRSAEYVLEAARVLLDAGADPDAGFLWRGLATPFTALTGVFGEGEQGPRRQPRHPHDLALATLLLERGAEANDGQTLYNRMFTPGVEHLELLFRYGLGEPDRGPWRRRLGDAMETPAQILDRQLRWAAEHGFADRLDVLARHGVDVSGVQVRDRSALPDDVNAKVGGRTALHDAAWDGDLDRIEQLLAAGADPNVDDDEHGGRPLAWAEYAYQEEAAALLRRHTPGVDVPPA